MSESVTESDDRWPIVQILDGKDARGAHRAGYSLRSCTQYAMNSDPQGEPGCDECDHPAWSGRSDRCSIIRWRQSRILVRAGGLVIYI